MNYHDINIGKYHFSTPEVIRTPHRDYKLGDLGYTALYLQRYSEEMRLVPYQVISALITLLSPVTSGVNVVSIKLTIDIIGDIEVPVMLRDDEDNYHALGSVKHRDIYVTACDTTYSNIALGLIHNALSQYDGGEVQ